PLPAEVLAGAEAALGRRLAREPLAQILGAWEFHGRSFKVTRDTLVPRPDTETLVDLALARPFDRLIDLGTGTGAIAVTLLAERGGAGGVASDISGAALAVAAGNAAGHGVGGRLQLIEADWWDGVDGAFDLVVSNPPYVTEAEYAALAPEVTEWEPRGALTPGGDGLSAYRAILAGLRAHLVPGGRCLVEIGAGQGDAVAALFAAAGLADVAVHPDINGKPRVVEGTMPKRHAAPKIGSLSPS
ncbi:peptide chain release factor N(5)-glutamine methyltransferase, partial [Rhodobacterales bacterium HKCCSP123]|nr:peptide chain release factor N(5)-glutamine methyltransferase [Rhodobacterales bacterium HKCCSP123]